MLRFGLFIELAAVVVTFVGTGLVLLGWFVRGLRDRPRYVVVTGAIREVSARAARIHFWQADGTKDSFAVPLAQPGWSEG